MAITKILNITECKAGNPAAHLKNAIEYIQNPDKTEKCMLVGSMNCLPDMAFEQMMETKEIYQKTGKRQGYHIIISFSPEEVVTPEQAMYVVEHFAKDVLGDDYETVYAVHTDKEHMHAHLIWNSVSLVTGKKYNSPKGNWKNKLQPITNKYCSKLGLAICPAEYSKNPVNMTRNEWQKEQEFKEFIYQDAKFCAYSAGSVEHFIFLMKRLGYEFESGKYLSVRLPGRRLYHRLDKMDEMFEEGKLKNWIDMPWAAKPYFYTKNPKEIYHYGMTEYQKRFYVKMYRMRVVEHKRFDYKSAYMAEELRKFHRLQDEYLLLVNNDIKSLSELVGFAKRKKNEQNQIDKKQHEIYKDNQRRKKQVSTPQEMREYQKWHLEIQEELDRLKKDKKQAKVDYKLALGVISEKVYFAPGIDIHTEPVFDSEKVEMPVYWEELLIDDMVEKDIEVLDTPVDEIVVKVEKQSEEIDKTEKMMTKSESFDEYEMIEPEPLEQSIYENLEENSDYSKMQVEKKETNSPDEIFVVKPVTEKADDVVRKLAAIGGKYEWIKPQVKAEIFAFDLGDGKGNLALYMKVIKKMGISKSIDELFEDYQEIYDETVKRQREKERQEEKRRSY